MSLFELGKAKLDWAKKLPLIQSKSAFKDKSGFGSKKSSAKMECFKRDKSSRKVNERFVVVDVGVEKV